MTRRRALYIGTALGLGLLTKAYFLVAVPPVLLLFAGLWIFRRLTLREMFTGLALACAPVITLAGWWYVRNIVQTGTLSGLSESVMLHGRLTTLGVLKLAGEVNWSSAIDSILLSHIWFGGWSSLTIRSWMYHVLYLLIFLAAIGVAIRLRHGAVAVLLLFYLSFWLGQLFNVLLLFAAKGVATSMGWYLYAAVAAEVGLFITGLLAIAPVRLRPSVPAFAVCVFVLLDLYTIHAVALPYYTGIIAHRPNGSLAALHLAASRIGLNEFLLRLTAFKSGILNAWMMRVLWGAYLLGTSSLAVIALRCCVKGRCAKTAMDEKRAPQSNRLVESAGTAGEAVPIAPRRRASVCPPHRPA